MENTQKNEQLNGRVRRATHDDVHAIARLVRRAQIADGIPRIAEPEITELMERGEMIVLATDPEELVAAACLTIARGRGHLAFLVIDPAAHEVETRMLAVAAALSESMRCAPTFGTWTGSAPLRRAS